MWTQEKCQKKIKFKDGLEKEDSGRKKTELKPDRDNKPAILAYEIIVGS